MAIGFVFCKAKCHRTKRDFEVGNGQRLCLVLQNETRHSGGKWPLALSFARRSVTERNETLRWEMARGFVLCHRTKRDAELGNGQRLCLVSQNERRH